MIQKWASHTLNAAAYLIVNQSRPADANKRAVKPCFTGTVSDTRTWITGTCQMNKQYGYSSRTLWTYGDTFCLKPLVPIHYKCIETSQYSLSKYFLLGSTLKRKSYKVVMRWWWVSYCVWAIALSTTLSYYWKLLS